ncbi:Photosystem I P700 chlorophyll a apoprotein A1 [Frankliniella fusca]|uniref:Photosystem I P700 chlorophyll a apoprotein A1 n=1 Tax=Frankliniella fusca TaxID=407009 RepID=A0AAE1LA43_9NEOP|nr:Photosystem I P700 chlorophyll a apoprotein A1 [Frankliniella fusca]
MTDRGCCCCTLETCVRLQGLIVAIICFANMARVTWKATRSDDAAESAVKQTSAGALLDGADFLVNGLGALVLFVASLLLLRGVRLKRPSLLQPYLVCAVVEAVALALLAVLYGVAAAQSLPERGARPTGEHPDVPVISVGQIGALVVFAILLLIAFPTYCLLNVSSLYDYMKYDDYRREHFYYIGT